MRQPASGHIYQVDFPVALPLMGERRQKKAFQLSIVILRRTSWLPLEETLSVLGCPGRGVIVGWVQPSAGPGSPGFPCVLGGHTVPQGPLIFQRETTYMSLPGLNGTVINVSSTLVPKDDMQRCSCPWPGAPGKVGGVAGVNCLSGY